MATSTKHHSTELADNPGREQFASRLTFVLASMGGAIGLGSIWKFPYVVGQYGGAAFIIVFLLALLLVVIPILITELAIGRKTQTSYTSALRILLPGKKWYILGIIGVITLTLTLSFYSGIAGWTIAWLLKSITGEFAGLDSVQVAEIFQDFIVSPFQVILYLFIMLLLTTFIVMRGIKNGIEKVCNILLPLLFVLIVFLAIRSVFLPGAEKGLVFYLKPNFSSLTGEAIMAAIGLAFFTLGVGCGNLVVYGSYLNRQKTLGSSAVIVALGDTLAAILFGFIIFPAAFAFNIKAGLGPPLVFITLPAIFAQMQFGMFFAAVFFLLLFFACLTSTICIMEAIVGYAVDEWKMKRKKATISVAIIVFLLGTVMMLSFGPLSNLLIFGKTIFDFANDTMVTTILLPLGGLFMMIVIGWILKPAVMLNEINKGEGMKIKYYFIITVRYIAPIAIVLMFLQLIGVINF